VGPLDAFSTARRGLLAKFADFTTTMRYVHPTPEYKRKAAEKLEQFNVEQLFAQSRNSEFLQKSLQ
jgi:hypothetical protein